MFYHLQSHISAARRSPRGVCEVLRLAARGAADGDAGDAGDAGVGVAPARVNTWPICGTFKLEKILDMNFDGFCYRLWWWWWWWWWCWWWWLIKLLMSENRKPTQKMMVNHRIIIVRMPKLGVGPHFFKHTQFDGFWGYWTKYGDLIRNKSGLSDKLQENSVSSLESGFFTTVPFNSFSWCVQLV